MIPLSVFPFPSAPCRKRVVSYPIIAFCCRSFNLSIAALPWGRFSFVQPLSLLRRQGRVAAPSVCFVAARILLAAAPTAPPCFRHWRRSSPLLPKGEALEQLFYAKRGPDNCPALFEVSAYSALVSGFASSALASGFAAGATGAAGFTTGFGGYGSSFRGKRMIFFGHFWAHIPQPLHLS